MRRLIHALRARLAPPSEVVVFGNGSELWDYIATQEFRITRRRGRVIGIETWTKSPGDEECGRVYGYTVWKDTP